MDGKKFVGKSHDSTTIFNESFDFDVIRKDHCFSSFKSIACDTVGDIGSRTDFW